MHVHYALIQVGVRPVTLRIELLLHTQVGTRSLPQAWYRTARVADSRSNVAQKSL